MSDWPQEAYSSEGMIPHLSFAWSGSTWEPKSNDFVIGREAENNGLRFEHPSVSRAHVRVFLEAGRWQAQKLGRSFLLNGHETDAAALSSGDQLQIGPILLHASITFAPVLVSEVRNGVLKSPDTEVLSEEKFYIGSDAYACRVIIAGASAKHALVYRHKSSGNWWVVDCASSSGVKVNGTRIRNERLYHGDKISVAGISMLFSGDELQIGRQDACGLELDVEQVSVSRNGFAILQDVSFHVDAGDFIGVLGPSGCGKSSLIQRMVGLDSFDKGRMKINGQPYEENKELFQSLAAYMPQTVALHEDLTLEQEVDCFCRLHASSTNDCQQRAQAILRLVGLENATGKRVGELSGGQQRRAGIALELLRDPQLLMLDEPTAGLDPATETEIMTYLRRIANQNRTVICSTHIMGNMKLFDKVLLMARGRVVFFGTPFELMDYFRVSDPLELYRLLGRGSAEEQAAVADEYAARHGESALCKKSRAPASRPPLPLPAPRRKSSFPQQLSGYLQRMFLDFFSFRNSKSPGKAFWGSGLFIQLLFQPLAIALVIKYACAQNFFSTEEQKNVLFFCAVSVFWLGLNNAVRELVKERVPWRCLERLEQIGIGSYLTSKALWTSLLCLIQVAVFWVCLKHIPEAPLFIGKPLSGSPLSFSLPIAIVLYLVGIMGAWIALAVSAIFKKENSAIGLLPIILIPVLFFSQSTIRDDTFGGSPYEKDSSEEFKSNRQYSLLAVQCKRIMPCYEPQVLMDKINNKQAKASDWLRMFRNTGVYMLLALALMAGFQLKNEKEWEGR